MSVIVDSNTIYYPGHGIKISILKYITEYIEGKKHNVYDYDDDYYYFEKVN